MDWRELAFVVKDKLRTSLSITFAFLITLESKLHLV